MATFADLDFKDRKDGPISLGIHAVVFFPNGFGASVVRSRFSYGGEDGLYELAVLEGAPGKSRITYDTPITEGVLGYLTEADVTDALGKIEALPLKSAA